MFMNFYLKLEYLKALPLGQSVSADTLKTSSYGHRKDPKTKRRKFHLGIDISGNLSKKIVSNEYETVIYTGPCGRCRLA